MKKTRFSLKKRQEIFDDILQKLIDSKVKIVHQKELKKLFKEHNHNLQYCDFKELKIREKLLENDISSHRSTSEKKLKYFKELVNELKKEQVSVISNNELITRMKEQYGIALSSNNISEFGFRKILNENDIKSKFDKQLKLGIIDNTINYIEENKIII